MRPGRGWAVAVGVDITSEVVRVRGATPSGRLLFVRESPLDPGLPMGEAVQRWHRLVPEGPGTLDGTAAELSRRARAGDAPTLDALGRAPAPRADPGSDRPHSLP